MGVGSTLPDVPRCPAFPSARIASMKPIISGCGGSSSPKKVAAAFKIATSSRDLRFAAFNRRISSDSSLVTPSR